MQQISIFFPEECSCEREAKGASRQDCQRFDFTGGWSCEWDDEGASR